MMRVAKKVRTKKFFLCFAVVFLISINVIFAGILLNNQVSKTSNNQQKNFAELEQFKQKSNWSFDELSTIFTNIAEQKGAVYAYEILRHAELPPQTDFHLLGHVVGDVLYLQQGTKGMEHCTQEFRNACSHSVVVGTLLEKGEQALDEITQACQKAPGGKGAYTMCFHGLGHGVLAYTDYKLPEAITLCNRTGGQESAECIGGTIMEIISGGDHDKKTWGKQSQMYLTTNDPLYPCTASYMPDNAKELCLSYLTPHLITRAGGDFGMPNKQDVKQAMLYCENISKNTPKLRQACFGGFGKELVVLVPSRDIRLIDSLTTDQLIELEGWCRLGPHAEAIDSCNASALSSLYWGGENDRQTAINFCSILTDNNRQQYCFDQLFMAVNYYQDDLNYKNSFCAEVPSEYSDECLEKVL